MQYGFFDDKRKEYVIETPETPMPWINYLGSQEFFSLISNTAGGYCFYRDAKLQRILRYATIMSRQMWADGFSTSKRKIKRPGAPPSIPWIGRWTVTAAVMVWATPFLRRRRTAFTRS